MYTGFCGGRHIKRVLVIGLDGATWDILRPLAERGRLPNLRRMIEEGATGVLQSTVPPVTPAAWTSFFTGKNPGKHGIYDFETIDPDTYQFRTIQAHRHREKSLWQLAGEHGKRSILIDVPFTYPPRPLEGLMISGYGTPRTPGTTFTYPPEFKKVLPEALHSEIRVALPGNSFDRSARFVEEWEEIMGGRRALLDHLVSAEAWDFFMVVFSITDNMAHVFWTYADEAHPNFYRPEAEAFREAFYRSYEQCDRLTGMLMDAAGNDVTTLIISDHGFGSVRPRQYLFQRLLKGGYLQVGGAGQRGDKPRPAAGEFFLRAAVGLYGRFPKLRELVKSLQPNRREQLKGALQKAGAMPDPSTIDSKRSKVILSNFGLQLWLNDAERFAHGPVSSHERKALLAELSQFLLEDVDNVTGERIIRAVHRGQDVYEGPFAARCPDLVIEYNNQFGLRGTGGQKNAFTEGGHTHDGILLAYGEPIATREVEGASLMDLAPTILHLLGLPVSPDMDGRVIEALFTEEFLGRSTVMVDDAPAVLAQEPEIEAYEADEDEDIREQLRQLGYL